MSWLDHVDGAETIRKIFGASLPEADGLRVHAIELHQDGPAIGLRFDLAHYPADPPAKWRDAGFNTVQVRLVLDQVTSVELRGWTTNNIGKLEIQEAAPTGFQVQLICERCRLDVACDFIRLDRSGLTAYIDTAR